MEPNLKQIHVHTLTKEMKVNIQHFAQSQYPSCTHDCLHILQTSVFLLPGIRKTRENV